jgi:hypothetical protein
MVDMNTNSSLLFKSKNGGKEWNYSLILNDNKKFNLKMNLINQDNSREDYDYNGDYLATFTNGEYLFTFSNVMRSGTRRKNEQSDPELIDQISYTKTLSGVLPYDDSFILRKDSYQINMKLLDRATCVDFLDSIFPETCLVDTIGDWVDHGVIYGYSNDEWESPKTCTATHKACGCFSYFIPAYYITRHKRGQYFAHGSSKVIGKCKYCGEDTN